MLIPWASNRSGQILMPHSPKHFFKNRSRLNQVNSLRHRSFLMGRVEKFFCFERYIKFRSAEQKGYPPGIPTHIPPGERRKIIDSKVPLKGYMFVPRSVLYLQSPRFLPDGSILKLVFPLYIRCLITGTDQE